uniref:Uncharacterized protein n=1 Tax=Candidatus Enterococcus clewellii TaxID=1834193 RepID=A0A242KC62_9ENTE|nr:hypothetical protein A5888_000473 [Enterococcus sp. 9E7_DIV0242]
MEQAIKDLVFRLTNCQGIGNIGILRILKFILEKEYIDFTKEELIRLGAITKYRENFIHSWDQWAGAGEQLLRFQQQHQFLTILDRQFPANLKEIYNSGHSLLPWRPGAFDKEVLILRWCKKCISLWIPSST